MSDTPTTLRIKFTRANDYRILTANGAVGAAAANGTLAVDFYVERVASPDLILYQVEGEGPEQKVQETREREGVIVREAQVGFLFSPIVARAIGMWLIEQASNLDNLIARSLEEREEADGTGN